MGIIRINLVVLGLITLSIAGLMSAVWIHNYVGRSNLVIHDGTRTGPRVGYASYCHPEQGIVIYENEKMNFTKDDGENVLWTQGDIDCYKQKRTATEAPTPTATSKTTIKNTTHVVSDPVVDCGPGEISKQYVKDKQSNCKNYVDCALNNNTIYSLMLNSECVKKHSDENSTTLKTSGQNQTSNKIPVFVSYLGITMYCPAQNAGAVTSINSTMESKKQTWASQYNSCANSFMQTDSCYTSCKSTNNYEWNLCTSAYGYSGSNYDACTKEASANYSSCISQCPSSAQHCDYIYSESKSYVNQMTDLCK